MLKTTCCIVGGGPAGMMLGLLLARAGIETIVLEKHADFFRDFRGDTIHPSTLEIISDLGLLEDLLKRPHQKASQLKGYVEDLQLTIADFSRLKVKCPYIAFMPQWDFLDFLAANAKKYSNFHLKMQSEATDLIIENDKIIGVKAKTLNGEIQINCDLVIGADGRHSIVRQAAGLHIDEIGAPMDVFWFRLSRKASDPSETFGRFTAGKIMILINRLDYWQCGYVIAKGENTKHQQEPIDGFRQKISSAMSFLQDRVSELNSWDDVKLLTVNIDRLQTWYSSGLLCIGDAAHAMSPVGGVGINLAIQDAVATANILSQPLKNKQLTNKHLNAVQMRREFPMKVIQKLQTIVQKRVIVNVLHTQKPLHIPWIIRKIQALPITKRIIGHIIGIGVRPEHINQI